MLEELLSKAQTQNEKLMVDFTVTTPLSCVNGSYDPDIDSFAFSENIPLMAQEIVKEKVLQKIGHEYGS